jgi:hypothetical protein
MEAPGLLAELLHGFPTPGRVYRHMTQASAKRHFDADTDHARPPERRRLQIEGTPSQIIVAVGVLLTIV